MSQRIYFAELLQYMALLQKSKITVLLGHMQKSLHVLVCGAVQTAETGLEVQAWLEAH